MSCGRWRAVDRRRGRAGGLLWCVLLLAVVSVASESRAHNIGDSYLYLRIYEDSVDGRFEVALSDFNAALGLAGTVDEITPANLPRRIDSLRSYYREKVTISDDRGTLSIDFDTGAAPEMVAGFAQLPFTLGGLEAVPERLTFEYSVLFDENPDHRGFLLVEHNWATGTFANESGVSLVFGPGSRRQSFDLTTTGRLAGFLALARLGAEHMLEGVDHVFFLAALLLTTVVRREKGRWRAIDRPRPALANAVVVVTAFLVAHGFALCLAALGLLRLPDALVETAIAASTVVAAANILFPLFRSRVWWIVAFLSFFHGLGFAGALLDLGVLGDRPGLSLLAFNLGAEVGQLLIAVVLFPPLFALRRLAAYRRIFLPFAACCLILVSGVWVIERAFGVDVPMREQLPMALQEILP